MELMFGIPSLLPQTKRVLLFPLARLCLNLEFLCRVDLVVNQTPHHVQEAQVDILPFQCDQEQLILLLCLQCLLLLLTLSLSIPPTITCPANVNKLAVRSTCQYPGGTGTPTIGSS